MPSKARLVDERADERAVRARIADPHAPVDAREVRHDLVVDALVHEEAAQGGAALAGRAHGREGDAADREVEIGRRA